MSVLDYKDRKYDMLAFRGAQPLGRATLDQSLFDADSSGEICVGIQKLAQRWVLEFLTESGSMQFQPRRGCQFMRDARQGRLRQELDVETSFDFSMLDAQRNLVNDEYAGMPADERFASAELLQITIVPGYINLSVQINSQAGDSRTVIMPINILA